MKQIILVMTALALLFSVQTSAQESEEAGQYERPYSQLIQGGFSFGYYGYGYVGSRTGFTLPVSASYETFVADDISAGGFLGYSSYRYQGYSNYEYKWSFLNFGVRGSYHYIPLLNELTDAEIDQSKWDFYISLMLIFERRSYSSSDDYYEDYYQDDFNMNLGSVAGFRYKFSDFLSLYFEGGRGSFGYGNLGVTLMF